MTKGIKALLRWMAKDELKSCYVFLGFFLIFLPILDAMALPSWMYWLLRIAGCIAAIWLINHYDSKIEENEINR